MPGIALGDLRASDRTNKRLKALLYFMSDVLKLPCAVVDIRKDRVVYEFPPQHINACFCKRLESATGNRYDLNHFLERCHRIGIDSTNSVYACPFGLVNILVPVFDNDEYMAALQIGPFNVENSEDLLLRHGLAGLDISSPSEALQDMLQYLRRLPKGTTDYLVAITRISKAFLADDQVEVQLKSPSAASAAADDAADYDLIYAIQQFVAENYMDPNICLEMVASHVYVHSSYVSHIFSEKFNVGFRDYVNWLRVKRAKELLSKTNKPIGEICRAIGYSDHSYFNKIFRRWEGITPTEYRKATKARGGQGVGDSEKSASERQPLVLDCPPVPNEGS